MQIENFRPQIGSVTNVLALFDIYSPKLHLRFRNLKLLKTKNGNLFVGFPSFCSGEDSNGKKTFEKWYAFEGEVQKKFEQEVLELAKSHLNSIND